MERRFHLFVRRCGDAGWAASVLTQPRLASFGAELDDVRADIARVASRLLARGALTDESDFWPSLRMRRIDVQVRAVQKSRLLTVPMRFSIAVHGHRHDAAPTSRKAPSGPVTVRIPRLGFVGDLSDAADLEPFVEEVVRHELYLEPVERLLAVAYEGDETVETLTVSYKPRPERVPAQRREKKPPRRPLPAGLGEAARRLNDEVAAGLLERAFQRDDVLEQLGDALARRHSVLLVGAGGVGKTTLVHELAHRYEGDGAPERESDRVEIYTTSANRIVAGMRYLGEWQARVERMIAELRVRRAVLHIESLAELFDAGGASAGMDIAGYLEPAIEAGEIAVVAEATPEDLARAERSHPALTRVLRPLVVEPLAGEAALVALRAAASRLGRQRRVHLGDDAIARAVELSERFGDGAALPGGAVQLLRATAHAPVGGDAPAARARTLGADDVTHAFVARTGYPREIVDPRVPLDPDAVLAKLVERVVGQDAAMTLLRDLVVTLKTGLSDPSRPLASFLLLGPTGVGKTESALALADYLFGDSKRMARFDMAEYAAPGSALRLGGGVGGVEGTLARRLREQPFGIVLLDEIEKADPGVHDLLLQILGEGRLTDGTGRTVSCRNTVVMLTSNLGADSAGRSLGFGDGRPDTTAHYVAAAARFFRPELLNRLDHVVPYASLSPATVQAIARRALAKALGREGFARRGVTVRYDDAVVERIAALGFDARYGARPLHRAIEHWVVAPLARVLAARGESRGAPLEVVVRGDAVAIAPSTPHEVARLDDEAARAEVVRRAARLATSHTRLHLAPLELRARRWALWLAERYAAWCARHGARVTTELDAGTGVVLVADGGAAALLALERGTHELTVDGEVLRVEVRAGGAASLGTRCYLESPSPSVLDVATGCERVAPWNEALDPAGLDRFLLARALTL